MRKPLMSQVLTALAALKIPGNTMTSAKWPGNSDGSWTKTSGCYGGKVLWNLRKNSAWKRKMSHRDIISKIAHSIPTAWSAARPGRQKLIILKTATGIFSTTTAIRRDGRSINCKIIFWPSTLGTHRLQETCLSNRVMTQNTRKT